MNKCSACNLPTELLTQISSYLSWTELSFWARLNREHEACISPILYHWLKPYDHKPAPVPERASHDQPPSPEPFEKSRCAILRWAASKDLVETMKKVIASEDIGGRIDIPIAKNGEQRRAGKGSMTLMHMAALSGHANVINYLVEIGGNVNTMLGGHIRPIHLAHTGEVVRALVRHGSSLAPTGLLSISPLTHALSTGCKPDATAAFLELGCDPHAISLDMRTPGLEAIRQGDIQSLKLLLKAGLDVTEAASVEGSWIYRAIETKPFPDRRLEVLLDIIALLIKYGAPVHGGRIIVDDGPWKLHYLQSNLFLAASMPWPKDLVQLLLHHGANPNGQSWMMQPVQEDEEMRLVIRPEMPLKRIFLGEAQDNEGGADAAIDALQVFIRHGAELDRVGGKPNFLAELLSTKPIKVGLIEILFYLTGILTDDPREPHYLAEPLLKPPVGPIHPFLGPESAWFSRPRQPSPFRALKLFTRLLELGAEANTPDSFGNSPLQLACKLPLNINALKYIRALEAHGADMNVGSGKGDNVVLEMLRWMGIPQEEHRNRFQGLLMGPSGDKIDVNVRDCETGMTPLATLASLQLPGSGGVWRPSWAPPRDLRILMVRMLLRRGADPNITQATPSGSSHPRMPLSGGNAIHYACDSGDANLLSVLLDHCAKLDVNSFTDDGFTPLMILVRSAARRDTSRRGMLTMKDRLVQAGADVGVRDWEGKSAWDFWPATLGRPEWFWKSMLGDLHVPPLESRGGGE